MRNLTQKEMEIYMAGYQAGFNQGSKAQIIAGDISRGTLLPPDTPTSYPIPKTKRKVKQSPKQKLLTKMTKVKWNKYKKGSGKKTYVEIRGEVSRSQKYKKACKRL